MKKTILFSLTTILIFGVLIGGFLGPFVRSTTMHEDMKHMNLDEKREMFISLKSSIQEDMRAQHNYRCCLEHPCAYCIEKTPGHGEGAACDCLKDIIEGHHPCGECIGEILEGHGNQYLAEYFAKAIGEEVGEEHELTLKKIIEEKYGMPVEDQV